MMKDKDMPNIKQEVVVVSEYVARIAASVFKAVEERHELLPYMKKLLINNIITNMETLTDKEICDYIEDARARNLFNESTIQEGSLRENRVNMHYMQESLHKS